MMDLVRLCHVSKIPCIEVQTYHINRLLASLQTQSYVLCSAVCIVEIGQTGHASYSAKYHKPTTSKNIYALSSRWNRIAVAKMKAEGKEVLKDGA